MKALLDRIKRKIKTVTGRNIPKNYFYRPTGIYATSKDFIHAVADKQPHSGYVEVFPKLVSTLDVDEDFYTACLPDYPELNKKVETTYVVTAVQNGRIYTDNLSTIAVISQDNYLIGDVSFNYNNGKVVEPQKNYVFLQKYFHKPVTYKGVVFSMLSGMGAVNNYGHWLIDSIPRLQLLKESGWFDKVDWFLVPHYLYDYQKDSLQLLGIDVSKVIKGDKPLHLQADVVIASTAPRGTDVILPLWVVKYLRHAFLDQIDSHDNYPPYIYISRKDASIRQVTNEDEVISALAQYGFRTFVLSDLPFIEKVKLFASARVIVSSAGAGMVNLVFSTKGTKVLEIFAAGNLHPESYDKCNKAGLIYYYLISDYGKRPTNTYQALHKDVTVNIGDLKQKLDDMLQQPLQVQ